MRCTVALAMLLVACGGKLAADDDIGTLTPGGMDDDNFGRKRPPRPNDDVLVPVDAKAPTSSRAINDLDDPKATDICIARANAPRGKLYEETTRAYVLTNGYDGVTASIDNETANTVLTLHFTSPPTITEEPKGLVRKDRIGVFALVAMRPDAFGEAGVTEKIEVRSMASHETACWRTGERSGGGGSSTSDPAPIGVLNVSDRAPDSISGVLELPAADGTARIDFYAPIVKAPPGSEEPYVCCLKN